MKERFGYDDAARARDFIVDAVEKGGEKADQIQDGLILGSGLGQFTENHIDNEGGIDIDFSDIYTEALGIDEKLYRWNIPIPKSAQQFANHYIKDKSTLNYLNSDFSPVQPEESSHGGKKFNMENITSYEIKEDNYFARVYILTNKGLLDFYDDEIDMILKTTQTAISRQIDIKKLSDAAATDPLTQCYNRREFEVQLKRNVSNATRHNKELSVFMFDLDHFKEVNDTYGHQTGDLVLKEISALVKNNIRTADVLSRYGGEEFIAILPETNKQKAMELANRIRKNIETRRIKTNGDEIRVTASFGVSTLKESPDMNQLVHDADAMMYKAKLNGRNTVMPGLIKVCPSIEPKQKVEN